MIILRCMNGLSDDIMEKMSVMKVGGLKRMVKES